MNLRRVSFAWSLVLLSSIGCDGRQPLGPSFSVVSTPASLTATAVSFSHISLAWQDNSKNESGSEVYRSTTGPTGTFALRGPTGAGATSYSDGGLSGSSQYCYKVRAFKVSGPNRSYSPFSTTACATTPRTPLPAAPSALHATPHLGYAISVGWTDNSADETGFRAERAATNAGPWTSVGTTSSNVVAIEDFQFLGVEQPTCYRVFGFNSQGDSPPSNTDCATPPAAPTDFTATGVDATTVDFTWTDRSAVEEGYWIGIDYGDGYWDVVASVGPDATSYRLQGDYVYYYLYFAVAVKDLGYSDWSNEMVPTPPAGSSTVGASSTARMWGPRSATAKRRPAAQARPPMRPRGKP